MAGGFSGTTVKKTSIAIPERFKEIMAREHINFSGLVNSLLEAYFRKKGWV